LKGVIEGAEERGIEKGKAEGKTEGKAEEKLSIAKRLMRMSMSLNDISNVTGLSIDEINAINLN
jgi:predicted transposase/invertase (TIGR01784 family)